MPWSPGTTWSWGRCEQPSVNPPAGPAPPRAGSRDRSAQRHRHPAVGRHAPGDGRGRGGRRRVRRGSHGQPPAGAGGGAAGQGGGAVRPLGQHGQPDRADGPLPAAATRWSWARARTTTFTKRARAAPWPACSSRWWGAGGCSPAADVEAAFKPESNHSFAATRLVCVENTHNRGGGAVWPRAQQAEVVAVAAPAGAGAAPRRRAPAERGRRAGHAARPSWPRPSTPPACVSPRGWARRWDRCWRAAAKRSTAPTGCARCWAGACARPACWRRRRCTPWTTTSNAWSRITATPGCWPNGWRRSRAWQWIWRACRPTS